MSNTDIDYGPEDPSDMILRDQRQTMSTAVSSLEDDPQKAARAFELGEATGDHPAVIYSNLENYENQYKAALTAQLLNSSKYLRQYVDADPMHAKLSNDDYGNLDAVSSSLAKFSSTRAGQIFRAPEAIGGGIFEGAMEGFRKGWDNVTSAPHVKDEEIKDYPLFTALLQSARFPVDVGGALISAASEAVKGGTKAGYQAFTGDEQGAEKFSREMAGMAETVLTNTSGYHGIPAPTSAQLAKVHGILDRAKPWLDDGKEPPRGLDPEIDKLKFEQNKIDVDNLDEAFKASQGSATRERNPDIFASFIRQHTDAKIGISGDAVARLYGDKVPEAGDKILGFIPGLVEELESAKATGGDVHIPLADWLAKVDPEIAKALHDDIRVRPGGITKVEKDTVAQAKEDIEAQSKSKYTFEPDEWGTEKPGEKSFSVKDNTGKEIAAFSAKIEGDTARIADIYSPGGGKNSLGKSTIRGMLRQFQLEHPEITTINGERVTGAKVGGSKVDSGSGIETSVSWKPAEPIAEPLPSLRASSALEPLFSVGDRKLELKRNATQAELKKKAGGLENFHDFDLLDEQGQRVGNINLSEQAGGKELYIEMIQGGPPGSKLYNPNFFGPALIRDLARQLKAEFPDAFGPDGLGITGHRVSGAREKANSYMKPSASPSIKFDEALDWSQVEGFRQVLEGGQWKSMGLGLEAYMKPTELFAKHEQELSRAILEELGRITPKQVDVATPISLRREGTQQTVRGAHTQYTDRNPFITVALDSTDPIGVARHEAIHHLRQQGFFKEAEWETLSRAARDENWIEKFGIESRYSKLEQSAKLEEAIADGYRAWKDGKETSPKAKAIFERLKEFFDAIKTKFKEILGKDFTWEELFQKVDEGEIGSREGNAPRREGAFKADEGEQPTPFGKGAIMPIAQQKLYDKLIQQRHTEDLASSIRRAEAEQRKRQTQEWKADEKEVRAQVIESINSRPDIAADNYFSSGELFGQKGTRPKLDETKLTKEQKASLPKDYYAKTGFDPDDLGNLFGYSTGDAMVAKLVELNEAKIQSGLNAKAFTKRLVDMETERQMMARYGNLEQSILEYAEEQAVSENQLNILHEETIKLAEDAKLKFTISKDDLKTGVKEQFDEQSIGSHSFAEYMATVGKAGKAIEIALLKGDAQEAYRQAQAKQIAFMYAQEAKKLEKAMGQFDRIANRFKKQKIDSVEQEYTDFIQTILLQAGKGLERSIQNLEESINERPAKDLLSFIRAKEGEYRIMPVADFLLNPNFRKAYEDLTAHEFYGVKQSIDTLIKQGREEKQIIRAGEKADKAALVGEMTKELQTFPLKTYSLKEPGPAMKVLKQFTAAITTSETFLNRWDRDNPRGPFNQWFVRPMVEAANGEAKLGREYSKPYGELGKIKNVDKLVDTPLIDPLSITETNPAGKPYIGFSRKNLMAVLQNWGNESNRKVMADGHKISEATLQDWLFKNTTKEDWERAQKLGDIFSSIFNKSKDNYRRITGVAPEEVPIKPIETPHGTFDGWYHPLIYDPIREGKSRKLMGGDPLDQDHNFGAYVPNGYTKRRTGYIAPLSLNFDAVPGRMSQMLHDIAFREAIIETNKLAKDVDLRKAITQHYGDLYRDGLSDWIKGVAGASSINTKAQAAGARVSEYLRQNVMSTYIGYNVYTALKHAPTAAILSMRQVGPANFLRAVSDLYGKSEELGLSNSEFAMLHSEELQRRERHWRDTIAGEHREIQDEGNFRNAMIEKGSWLVAKSDMMSAKPMWVAAYRNGVEAGLDHGQAVFEADQKVRFAHGSTAVTNQPALVRGGGAIHGWLTTLYGFFGTMMQRRIEIAYLVNDTYKLGREGELKQAAANIPTLATNIFAYVIWPTLVEEWVTGLNQDDRRGWGQRLLSGATLGIASSIPYIRDIIHGAVSGHEPSVGLASGALHDVGNLFRDLGKGKQALSKEHAGKTVQDAITVFGEVTGMAPKELGNAARFGIDLYSGKAKPKTPQDWARGITRGKTDVHVEH